jgi:hypothetical protein
MQFIQHPTQLVFAAAAFASLAVALPASAHICLEAPVSRIGPSCGIGAAQKPGPCGINTRSTRYVTEFRPGETITVTLNETVDHPSHYRIAFNPNGSEFEDPANKDDKDGKKPFVLLDGIMDESAARQSVKVTLPNMTCDNCTLQLIQVMYDKTGNGFGNDDIYYACADIVLKGAPAGDVAPGDAGGGVARPAPDAGTGANVAPLLPPDAPRDASTGTGGNTTPDAGSTGGAGGADASGTGSGGTGGMDTSASGDDGDDGGCSITHDRQTGHVSAAIALLAFLALTARRRRDS